MAGSGVTNRRYMASSYDSSPSHGIYTCSSVRGVGYRSLALARGNGDDCGVFSIVLADYTAQRRAIDYTQFDMPFFRHSIALAICRQDL